jgi:hypothetical protein
MLSVVVSGSTEIGPGGFAWSCEDMTCKTNCRVSKDDHCSFGMPHMSFMMTSSDTYSAMSIRHFWHIAVLDTIIKQVRGKVEATCDPSNGICVISRTW